MIKDYGDLNRIIKLAQKTGSCLDIGYDPHGRFPKGEKERKFRIWWEPPGELAKKYYHADQIPEVFDKKNKGEK